MFSVVRPTPEVIDKCAWNGDLNHRGMHILITFQTHFLEQKLLHFIWIALHSVPEFTSKYLFSTKSFSEPSLTRSIMPYRITESQWTNTGMTKKRFSAHSQHETPSNQSGNHILSVSCQKGPTRHAYAWQIGPFWQDTLDMTHEWLAWKLNEYFLICILYYIISFL